MVQGFAQTGAGTVNPGPQGVEFDACDLRGLEVASFLDVHQQQRLTKHEGQLADRMPQRFAGVAGKVLLLCGWDLHAFLVPLLKFLIASIHLPPLSPPLGEQGMACDAGKVCAELAARRIVGLRLLRKAQKRLLHGVVGRLPACAEHDKVSVHRCTVPSVDRFKPLHAALTQQGKAAVIVVRVADFH